MPCPLIRLEPLPAEEGVDEIREDDQREGEPDRVAGAHQIRSRTYRSRKMNAKHAAAIARAATSYITRPSASRGRAEAAARRTRPGRTGNSTGSTAARALRACRQR